MHALFVAIQSDPITAAAFLALLILCFRLERSRSFKRGYAARGHDVLAHTLTEQRRASSQRE